MSGVTTTKLLTSTVYKKIPQNNQIEINHDIKRSTNTEMKTLDIWRDQLDVYDIQFLNDTVGLNFIARNICNNTLCCNFKVNYAIKNSTTKPHYQYAIAFYTGNRTFSGVVETGVAACAIIACPRRDITSCGTRDESLEIIHVWNSIEINGEFPMSNDQYFYMPSTLDDAILPLQPEQFEYDVKIRGMNGINVVMRLNKNVDNLLTFGVWGRDFSDEMDSGGNGVFYSMMLIGLLALIILRIW